RSTASLATIRLPVVVISPFLVTPTSPTGIATLSLHDALPILEGVPAPPGASVARSRCNDSSGELAKASATDIEARYWAGSSSRRSEEHTSELQSRENLVCRLLLEKKKKDINKETSQH